MPETSQSQYTLCQNPRRNLSERTRNKKSEHAGKYPNKMPQCQKLPKVLIQSPAKIEVREHTTKSLSMLKHIKTKCLQARKYPNKMSPGQKLPNVHVHCAEILIYAGQLALQAIWRMGDLS